MSVEARPKGSRIDRYELRDRVGEGGMGNVYRAVDTKIGRTVAVKVLVPPDGRSLTKYLRERFLREVLAISRIDHPNVVKVYDYGIAEDGTPYLVMEYLEGQDLAELLRENRLPIPIEQAADIMLEVCAALRACHEVSVVHRDLKPANIFLATTESGSGWQVKVVDFGISKAPSDGELTEHGQILGTLQYLSPEQVNGRAEPASDQYALGVLLYVCLTKRLPYGGLKDAALLRAIDRGVFKGPRVHRPEIPAALEAIVSRAMHLSPAERFESVYALGKALWEFASPLGRETWKKFYIHSPVPAPAHREISEGIPIALVRSLAEQRAAEEGNRADGAHRGEDQTELAHYQSTTAPNPAVGVAQDSGLSDAYIASPPPTPTLSAASATDPRSAHSVGPEVAEEGRVSAGAALTPQGDRRSAGGGRRQFVARAGALLTVAIAGGLAWAIHRPEAHLIRPARFPAGAAEATPPDRPVLGTEPVFRGAAGSEKNQRAASVEISPTATARHESAPGNSGIDGGQVPGTSVPSAAGDKTNGEPEGVSKPTSPKKHRARAHTDMETTPDGVPLLR